MFSCKRCGQTFATLRELSEKNLKRLLYLEKSSVNWLETEQVIAVSYVHNVTDEYGRKGAFNHTILVKVKDYLQLTEPAMFFERFKIRGMSEPKESLESVQIR